MSTSTTYPPFVVSATIAFYFRYICQKGKRIAAQFFLERSRRAAMSHINIYQLSTTSKFRAKARKQKKP